MPALTHDLTGMKFMRLTAIKLAKKPDGFKGRGAFWEWRCDCGAVVTRRASQVRAGGITSCGCMKRELLQESLTKHGECRTPLNALWRQMRNRCNNPNAYGYKYYGGKGIKVCARWGSFESFKSDMGQRPSPEHSIHRLDNDKGYEPANCVWATHSVQMNARSDSKLYDGKTLGEWSIKLNVSPATLRDRFKRTGSVHLTKAEE